jgi:hypothetical protein
LADASRGSSPSNPVWSTTMTEQPTSCMTHRTRRANSMALALPSSLRELENASE